MMCVRTSLVAAAGVFLIGLAPQAEAQFARTGPRVTGNGDHSIAPPPPPPVPEVAPVTVTADQPPAPPARPKVPPVDGALPGGVLGPGEEGVGALIRRPEPAQQLAQAAAPAAPASPASVRPAEAAPPPAPRAEPAPAHHVRPHRARARKPEGQPQS